MVSKKIVDAKDYGEYIRTLFGNSDDNTMCVCRDITFQITGECNLKCSYCYEHHKDCGKMSEDTGKKIVDYLLDLYEKDDSDYINKKTKALIFDFIGGEPLLEAELIEHIYDYFVDKCWERNIPLVEFSRISFATNGQLWFSPAAQHLFKKYRDIMSITVSIDGVKELHDTFRVDEFGIGSFSNAYAAFQDAKRYGWYNSKMTFVPSSTKYVFDSVKMMVNEGCDRIFCNYAYEPVYTKEDARNIYLELKKVSNWLVDNHINAFLSILDSECGELPDATDDKNYCGGTGSMLSFAPDGKAYPCIRYAPISIGKEKAEKMCLGNCYDGLYATQYQKDLKTMLNGITRSSQSTEECLNCPIGSGCGWCSGYCYELTGTPNKRVTHICNAHKGRVLATCYYRNKRYFEIGDVEPKKINLTYDETREIIGDAEAVELFMLEKKAFEKKEGCK